MSLFHHKSFNILVNNIGYIELIRKFKRINKFWLPDRRSKGLDTHALERYEKVPKMIRWIKCCYRFRVAPNFFLVLSTWPFLVVQFPKNFSSEEERIKSLSLLSTPLSSIDQNSGIWFRTGREPEADRRQIRSCRERQRRETKRRKTIKGEKDLVIGTREFHFPLYSFRCTGINE